MAGVNPVDGVAARVEGIVLRVGRAESAPLPRGSAEKTVGVLQSWTRLV